MTPKEQAIEKLSNILKPFIDANAVAEHYNLMGEPLDYEYKLVAELVINALNIEIVSQLEKDDLVLIDGVTRQVSHIDKTYGIATIANASNISVDGVRLDMTVPVSKGKIIYQRNNKPAVYVENIGV